MFSLKKLLEKWRFRPSESVPLSTFKEFDYEALHRKQEQFGEYPLAVLTYPAGFLDFDKDIMRESRPMRNWLLHVNINMRGCYERKNALAEKPYFLL